MVIRYEALPEPELEFGGGRHIDPRWGLSYWGPADVTTASAPKVVKVGLIGTEHDVAGLRAWLECCSNFIAPAAADTPRKQRMAHFYPPFPGFCEGTAFDSRLVFDERATRLLRIRDLEPLLLRPPTEAAEQAVALYVDEIRQLTDEGWADVILCARPDLPEPPDGQRRAVGEPGFHDLLKARAIQFNRPLQVIRRTTWGDRKGPIKIPAGVSTGPAKSNQDEATRAWNLHTALYYKAGGVPWRMQRRATDRSVCYVGVGFFVDQAQGLQTSVAQIFNQLGDGVVVRGGPATPHKDDKQPHLSDTDAHALLAEAIRLYRAEHHNMPARLVLHKTSSFVSEEVEGFTAAADAALIDSLDLLWVTSSDASRLFRAGTNNPPLRGTFLQTAPDRGVLYTRGTVPFYGAYPGMYVPSPLGLRVAKSERSVKYLAEEILALSKMNWNDTRLDGREPITLRTSRQVGQILRFTSRDQPLPGRYAYFM